MDNKFVASNRKVFANDIINFVLFEIIFFKSSKIKSSFSLQYETDFTVDFSKIEKGNFDLVLERAAVVDVKPQFDITRQVVERMNQSR